MKKIAHRFFKCTTCAKKHFKKHKSTYFGFFWTFAIVGTVWLLAKLFIAINIDRTFAAEVVVNKDNIVSEYGCALDTSYCDLSDRGITSIAPDTFINHTKDFVYINLRSNQLTSFELSTTTSIRDLLLEDNQLTEIDLSGLTNLRDLRLWSNQLTEIDLSGLTNLRDLLLEDNQLTEIDLSGLTGLKSLNIMNNKLTQLPSNLPTQISKWNITLNYIDISTIETDNDLVEFLDAKFNDNEFYGRRDQYVDAELIVTWTIASISWNSFIINVDYQNLWPSKIHSGIIYYEIITWLNIDSDMPFNIWTTEKEYTVFGDPCFDDFYYYTTWAYVDYINNLVEEQWLYDPDGDGISNGNWFDLIRDPERWLWYTWTDENAGKFLIDFFTEELSYHWIPVDRVTIVEMIGWDVTSLAQCGTPTKDVYIFDLGKVSPWESGSIVITWIINPNIIDGEIINNLWIHNQYKLRVWDNEDNNAATLSFIREWNNWTNIWARESHGRSLKKDVCENWDCSPSYYDWLCGVCTEKPVIWNIHQAPNKPGDITGSPYSNELNAAYLRAYNQWITTMPTIQKANIGGHLIRSHMAKMMVEFASLFEREINTWDECSFSDMDNQSDEMKYYATLACQLRIMWLDGNENPAEEFNPDGIVTRAEFGTAFSRLIFGGKVKNWKWKERYVPHLQALKDVNVMKKIDEPFMEELRWRVMLMMMRSAK